MRRSPLVASLLFFGALLVASNSGQATHSYDGQRVELRNTGTIDSLRISNAPEVILINFTINGTLFISSSDNIRIEGLWIGSSTELIKSEDADIRSTSFSGKVILDGSNRVTLRDSSLGRDLHLVSSHQVRLNSTVVAGCLSVRDSDYSWSSPSATGPPPTCATTPATAPTPEPVSPEPTPHPDYYCDGQFQATPCSPTPTPKPTEHYDYYCDGQFQSTPCEARPAPAPNENYTFELVGKQVYQDLWISKAQRVVIRDSQIFGSLGIGWSTDVVLEGVYVSDKLHIEQSQRVQIQRLDAGRMFGMANTQDFQVRDAFVAGFLGCYRCSDGVYDDVRVTGEVVIVESTNIQRTNVQSASTQTPVLPERPPEARPGSIRLNVTNSSLEFAHRKILSREVSADVQLGVDAIQARAKLDVPSLKGDKKAAIHLESRFEKLQEFEDRDGNGAYDLGDLVIREYLIEDLPVASIRQERLGGDEQGWVGRIDYALPNGGTMSLIFTAKESTADQTKIDVEVSNYEYSTRTSQLALQIRIASASEWSIEEGETEDRLLFNGTGLNGFFSWIHTAMADGEETDVTARVLEEHRTASGEREVVLILGYERARNLVHDPSIGVLEAASLGELVVPHLGNILVYGTTFLAVVAVLWALGQSGSKRKQSP